MTAVPTPEPDGAPRLASLDILRGVAILGILFMNVNDMGQSFSSPDIRHLGWSIADQVAWWVRDIVADGTARALLEMLFGAGMVILTDRIAQAAGDHLVLGRYFRRNVVLWVFGIVHMFVLLWPGDILHTYAVAAMVAVWFRRWRPRWLIALGLFAAVAQFGGAGYFGIYKPIHTRAEVAALTAKRDAGVTLDKAETATLAKASARAAKRAKAQAAHKAAVVAEDKARSGSTTDWVKAQIAKSVERLDLSELFSIWEAASTMLIGAALFKLGILQGQRSRAFYAGVTLAAYAFAVPLRVLGAYESTRFTTDPQFSWATDEFARLGMTLGHIGLIHLLLGTALGARLLRPFVAAGRTALTLYVLQTIVLLWVLFPPFGFALYGRLTWMPMMLVSAGVDLALLALAMLWVRHFAIAPVEWAWRSVVERRRLPFRAI
ncbi:DUF418 domain-containing protein [Sphingomonas ginsenosidivorax]|uniref:DUF418 domain-containing protein n=1 Tax=Sphingomonas ginsenosidivorax TaxID=862135 RepID=A0A5C6UEN2_9SPHN|nr:DUF418 domain-containing protein [Sphingomonas ginsenosidivorax]TXC70850.1 DUF418 domain-containing protein [Sphingomonas ginsenosidivorax]